MFVPTMTNRMVKSPNIQKYDLRSLKCFLISGAPISEALVRDVCDVLFQGDLRFAFTYGTSETTIGGCQLQQEEVSLKESNTGGKNYWEEYIWLIS